MLILPSCERSLVTVKVYYHMPDSLLINEFIWQTLDLRPRYPRVHKFINHWRCEIDAVIQEIIIVDANWHSILRI